MERYSASPPSGALGFPAIFLVSRRLLGLPLCLLSFAVSWPSSFHTLSPFPNLGASVNFPPSLSDYSIFVFQFRIRYASSSEIDCCHPLHLLPIDLLVETFLISDQVPQYLNSFLSGPAGYPTARSFFSPILFPEWVPSARIFPLSFTARRCVH